MHPLSVRSPSGLEDCTMISAKVPRSLTFTFVAQLGEQLRLEGAICVTASPPPPRTHPPPTVVEARPRRLGF